ncbi:MAG: helix-turn-helix transcriptional regulator [Xanthobacteraceae bacterium]
MKLETEARAATMSGSKKQTDQVDVSVGRRIREARIASGLSQTKVANALDITFQQIQKYENGINRVAPSRLVVIAKMTGRAVDWFFSDTAGVTRSKSPQRGDAISKLAASREGQRLARAFLAVKSPKLRSAFVNLLEGMLA